MKSNKQRIRVDYAPLMTSCSLTSNGALTQVYNALDMQFNPDRSLTPLILTPVIMASASDGTVGTKNAQGDIESVSVNARLGEMKWFVNGVDIRSLPEWAGMFTIDDTTADSRGTIAIYRNIPQGERVQLSFEALLSDSRTGQNLKVATRPVVLTCTDSADDEFSLAFEHGTSIGYNPLRDNLALYEYEVANGIKTEDAGIRAQVTDSECYIREIPVSVYRGGTRMTSGYSLKVLRHDAGGFTEVASGEGEVVSVTADGIVLDLRLVDACNYRVEAVVGGKVRTSGQFSVWRSGPAVETEVVNTASIGPSDKERRSLCIVRHRTTPVKYPARLFDIQWLSDTSAKGRQDVRHNIGEIGHVDLERAGFNDPLSAGWIDIFVDVDQKGPHAVAADNTGTEFTDKDGNIFIFTTIKE